VSLANERSIDHVSTTVGVSRLISGQLDQRTADSTANHVKGIGKGLSTCSSGAYVQRFVNSSAYNLEMATDWHELVISRHIMRSSTARDSGQ